MRKVVLEETHIVKSFMIGNTHIEIADNYCRDKTQEEVDLILRRIARTALENFLAAARKKKQADEEQQQKTV